MIFFDLFHLTQDKLALGGDTLSKKFLILLSCFICLFIHPSMICANEGIYLGGDSVGIEVSYDGVLISGTYHFTIQNKTYTPETYIQKKDIIKKINGVTVTSIADMQRELLTYQRTQSKDSIPITVLRKNQLIETSLFNVYDETDKVYKCGLYVKDKNCRCWYLDLL